MMLSLLLPAFFCFFAPLLEPGSPSSFRFFLLWQTRRAVLAGTSTTRPFPLSAALRRGRCSSAGLNVVIIGDAPWVVRVVLAFKEDRIPARNRFRLRIHSRIRSRFGIRLCKCIRIRSCFVICLRIRIHIRLSVRILIRITRRSRRHIRIRRLLGFYRRIRRRISNRIRASIIVIVTSAPLFHIVAGADRPRPPVVIVDATCRHLDTRFAVVVAVLRPILLALVAMFFVAMVFVAFVLVTTPS
ncbi:unnamed protein product [Closterium sp. NIES-53]